MARLASLWLGAELGPVEIASIRSFLRQGDSFTLYAYEPVAGVPEGVALRPASEVMSGEKILRFRGTGTPALHADLFRYAMIARTGETWVDLDVIALKPFDFPTGWVFGWEYEGMVNNAVLHLPPDSRTLARLCELRVDTVAHPPFLTGFRNFRYWLRGFGRGLPLEKWPWAGLGPKLLTHFLNETGEIAHSLPLETFYAIPKEEAGRFCEPGALRLRDLPEQAYGVHLWAGALRQELRQRHRGKVPEGSFLDGALKGELPR